MLRRLEPFDVGLHYMDRHRLPAEVERELGATWHETVESLVAVCDVVTINCPTASGDRRAVRRGDGRGMKRGDYLIDAAAARRPTGKQSRAACESGRLAGYAGDVWFPQPAPRAALGGRCRTTG